MTESKQSIDKSEIKDILQNYEDLEKAIQRQIRSLQEEINGWDEIIRNVSLPGQYTDPASGKHGLVKKDISDVTLLCQNMIKEREEEVNKEIYRLILRQFQIRKIYGCYQRLPQTEYEIFRRLYIEKESYKSVSLDFPQSKSTLTRLVRRGFQMIQEMYEKSMEEKGGNQ